MTRFASAIVIGIASAVSLASPTRAQPAFLEVAFSLPGAVSGEGSVVVGSSSDGLQRWTREGGMVSLGRPEAGLVFPVGVSTDGSVIVGFVVGANGPGFRWTEGEGFELIPQLRVRGVSGDGSTVVGNVMGTVVGARWVDGALEVIDAGPAHAASSDGSVMAVRGGRWEDGVFTRLDPVPGRVFNEITAVSADGSTIVGTSQGPGLFGDAALWSGAQPMSLGRLPGDDFAVAQDVSGDGSVVVGTSHRIAPLRDRVFVWSAELGMRNLRGVLQMDLGLDLTGWRLDEVSGVSDDGLTILGSGRNPAGEGSNWLAILGAPLPLDNFSCYPVERRRDEGSWNSLALADPAAPSGAAWRIGGSPDWYCVPSQKTRFDPPTVEPVIHASAHLACYAARRTHHDGSLRRVAVRSQFRERELVLARDRAVCVPTLEGEQEDPDRALAWLETVLDEFTCYASGRHRGRRGRGVGESILTRDPLFGEVEVEVGRERTVCSPAAVVLGREREELAEVEGPDHLACFGVETEDEEEERPEARKVAITNRFVQGETITLRGEAGLFCDAAFSEGLPPQETRRRSGRWRRGDRPRRHDRDFEDDDD